MSIMNDCPEDKIQSAYLGQIFSKQKTAHSNKGMDCE